MCQQPSANHERFPGHLKRAIKWPNLVHKATGCRLLFQLTLGRHLSLQKKKNEKNTTCRDRCAKSLVRQSCSRNNVVEPVGKTSLVLGAIFGQNLEKE